MYLWENSEAVIYGCYQNPFLEMDVLSLWQNKIPIIRRITGGGTVYHGLGNINYTWIRTPDYDGVDYARFLRPLVDALQALDYPVEIKNEIDLYLEGRKISGSAQKRKKDRVLHHGTLLFDCDLNALRRSGQKDEGKRRGKGVKSRPAPVRNLAKEDEDNLNERERVERRRSKTIAFKAALFRALGLLAATPLQLSEKDEYEIARLAKDKYGSWSWTFGEAPSFTFTNAFTLNDRALTLHYEAKKGVVREASFKVDGRYSETLSRAFTGIQIDPVTLREFSLNTLQADVIRELI